MADSIASASTLDAMPGNWQTVSSGRSAVSGQKSMSCPSGVQNHTSTSLCAPRLPLADSDGWSHCNVSQVMLPAPAVTLCIVCTPRPGSKSCSLPNTPSTFDLRNRDSYDARASLPAEEKYATPSL